MSMPTDFESQAEALAVLNAILRHHIRNHLTVISGRIQWLDRSHEGADPNIQTVLRRCEEMSNTVDKIETITHTILQESNPEPFDITAFFDEEIPQLRALYDVTLLVDMPESVPLVRADSVLSLAVRELLDNAETHTNGQTPTVSVSVEVEEDVVRISVADDGPGLPAAVVPDPFSHSVRGPESDGDGLGLFLCQSIVSQYDGEIALTEIEEGVTAEITLQRA
jgi:signal transduction histidine kinase